MPKVSRSDNRREDWLTIRRSEGDPLRNPVTGWDRLARLVGGSLCPEMPKIAVAVICDLFP